MIEKDQNDILNQWLFLRREDADEILWHQNGQVLVTLPGRKEVKHEILRLIKEARSYLKICTFILTDAEVIAALLAKAKERKVAIFILTQLDEKRISTDFGTEEEVNNNTIGIHLEAVAVLHDEGVHLRASKNVHAKFMIADGEEGLITSANLTSPSLNENPESGVSLSFDECLDLEKVFDLVYQKANYSGFFAQDSEFRIIKSTSRTVSLGSMLSFKSGISITFENDLNELYNQIIGVIDRAKSELIISTYSIVGLQELDDFVNSIDKAIKRGVTIRIFCRGMNYRHDHMKYCSQLADMGCQVRGDLANHSKGISNGKEGLIFTANIDGHHGLYKKGFEVGTLLKGDRLDEFHAFMHWQYDTAPYQLTRDSRRYDYFKTYDWYYEQKKVTPPDWYNHLSIELDGFEQSEIEGLANTQFFGIYNGNLLSGLEWSGQGYEGQIKDTVLTISKRKLDSRHQTKYLIRYNTLTVKIATP